MPATPTDKFRVRIAPILRHFAIEPAAVDRVCEAYNEKWRAYHTTHHILGMLRASERLPLAPSDRDALSLLIVYHDIWFKISRDAGENERMSARWAIDDLKSYPKNPEWIFALVTQGIEATITHTLDGVEERFVEIVSHLLDLDLWGLGQSAERFQEDTEKVWHEFEPRYTRNEFDLGRSGWAATFLKRPQIYRTQRFQHLEEQARKNLTALANQ